MKWKGTMNECSDTSVCMPFKPSASAPISLIARAARYKEVYHRATGTHMLFGSVFWDELDLPLMAT